MKWLNGAGENKKTSVWLGKSENERNGSRVGAGERKSESLTRNTYKELKPL